MKSNRRVECPKCHRKLAEVTENNFIIARHKLSDGGRVGCGSLDGRMKFECRCNFSGLFEVNGGWTYSLSQVVNFE